MTCLIEAFKERHKATCNLQYAGYAHLMEADIQEIVCMPVAYNIPPQYRLDQREGFGPGWPRNLPALKLHGRKDLEGHQTPFHHRGRKRATMPGELGRQAATGCVAPY